MHDHLRYLRSLSLPFGQLDFLLILHARPSNITYERINPSSSFLSVYHRPQLATVANALLNYASEGKTEAKSGV